MPDGIQFSLIGLEQLEVTLNEIKADMKFKGGRFALRKAANLVRDAGIQNALRIDDPFTAEQIAKNIVVRWSGRFFKRTGNLQFRVGVLGGARQYSNTRENRRKGRVGESFKTAGDKTNPGGDTFHWRFVEFGTSRSKAQPFFRKSLADNVSPGTSEFVTQYDKALVRALRRAKSKRPSKRARIKGRQ